MKFEELLSSKYIMFAFIGLCAGILALTAVEVGDDFVPALVLSLVNLTAGVLVLVQLKRRFAPTAVLFFVLSVFSILFCLDGFFEDLSEVFSDSLRRRRFFDDTRFCLSFVGFVSKKRRRELNLFLTDIKKGVLQRTPFFDCQDRETTSFCTLISIVELSVFIRRTESLMPL